jgi:hypothetical protein
VTVPFPDAWADAWDSEWALLHTLAHAVTSDEPPPGDRTRGHHHAWCVHYELLARKMLGYRAARYLRQAFASGGTGGAVLRPVSGGVPA